MKRFTGCCLFFLILILHSSGMIYAGPLSDEARKIAKEAQQFDQLMKDYKDLIDMGSVNQAKNLNGKLMYHAGLLAKVRDLASKIEKLETSAQVRDAETKDVQSKAEEAAHKLSEVQLQLGADQSRLREIQSDYDSLQYEHKRLQSDLDSCQARVSNAQSAKSSDQSRISSLEGRLSHCESNLLKTEEKLSDCHNQASAPQDSASQLSQNTNY